MSETNQFQEQQAINDRLSKLTPEEFVQLIGGLCQAVSELDVNFYGGVNAANISMDEEGNVGLGNAMAEADVRYTAEQIEYLAPEVFWNNTRSPQADVYSIGIMMYAWSNGGCLPFLYPNATASDRAEALRRRMSGEKFEVSPVSKTLNKVVDRATAFKAEDRYATAAELLEAFQDFAAEAEENSDKMVAALASLQAKQMAEAQMMANILAAAQAAAGTGAAAAADAAPAPKQTRKVKKAEPAPQPEPEKKRMSLRPLIAVLLIAAILMVAAVAMQFGNANSDMAGAGTSATPAVPTADPNASPDITPSPSPTVTPPAATPVPTVNPNLARYSLHKADVTWNQAADACINAGGTLVCPSTKEEFDAVTALADQYNMKAIWCGGFRKSGNIVWLDGKGCDYMPWAAGEPSANGQHFVMLVKGDSGWAYRDMADNGNNNYTGSVCYILEK